MKKKFIVLLLSAFYLSSCNRNDEIKLENIFGTYEYIYHDNDPKWNLIKHVIVIHTDTTYFHKIYQGNELLTDEHGIYKFNRFVPGIKFFEFTAYNKHLYETPSKREYFVFVIKRTLFGSVYLTFNWPFDPDSAPRRPKYKKIK